MEAVLNVIEEPWLDLSEGSRYDFVVLRDSGWYFLFKREGTSERAAASQWRCLDMKESIYFLDRHKPRSEWKVSRCDENHQPVNTVAHPADVFVPPTTPAPPHTRLPFLFPLNVFTKGYRQFSLACNKTHDIGLCVCVCVGQFKIEFQSEVVISRHKSRTRKQFGEILFQNQVLVSEKKRVH